MLKYLHTVNERPITENSDLILRPRIITFLLHLLFDLGHRGFLFASTTYLEAGTRFAGICYNAFFACFDVKLIH